MYKSAIKEKVCSGNLFICDEILKSEMFLHLVA
jgi:hypothetical protein